MAPSPSGARRRRLAHGAIAPGQPPAEAGAAVSELERLVLSARGVVLRYGRFYGPGTYYEGEKREPPRVHVDDPARRTVDALDAASGIVEIADREPPTSGEAAVI
jgi:hypothetical protein